MRYFVTGGAGFIGSNMVDRLLSEPENEVVAYDKDGRRVASEVVRTAGQPHRLKLEQASPADGRQIKILPCESEETR